MRGRFISFEGSEGSGKSTQIARLVELLQSFDLDVVFTREPGGTAVGEKIRDLLQFTPEAQNMTNESELLLFAASRAQLVREVIAPTLANGVWVIADRFLDSTTVYQGMARGIDREIVEQINGFAVGQTIPDWTILLDLDAATGHSRALKASHGTEDRIEDQPLEFFEKVRHGYLNLARTHPDRIQLFDASLSVEEISSAISDAFMNRFAWLSTQ